MLFRALNGKLIEICRIDYATDDAYYGEIIKAKYNITFPKKKDVIQDILNIISPSTE